MSKKILVTGAAGFIGFYVAKYLLERGDTVVGIDNINDYYDPKLKLDRLSILEEMKGFSFIKIDIAENDKMEVLFSNNKFDAVVHLAAQAGVRYSLENPHAYMQSNIVGFLNILEGVRHNKIEHLVYASSSSVYGANTLQPFSEHHNIDHPVSLYAASKKSNELMAHSYSHLYGMKTTALRFFTVYGPWGRPDMAPFLFAKGIFDTERVVALTGHEMPNPRYVRARQGVCIERFVTDVKFQEQKTTTDKEGKPVTINRKAIRLISGDPLTGKEIESNGYLGFFDDQLMTIEEGDYYELFGWLIPRAGHPTQNRTFPGAFAPSSIYKADTQQNGEERAFVVSGEYESVLPMDIYPQYLLRAIQANDFEKMEGLGILELGEEDLALCEYVCTSKHPVQRTLRQGLDMLREQG